MRRRGKVDANQSEVVEMFRKCGASVQSLADIGKGCPDLVVGIRGVTLLVEVKDGSKPPSQQQLTDDEIDWMRRWRGSPVHVVTSAEVAAQLVKRVWGEI